MSRALVLACLTVALCGCQDPASNTPEPRVYKRIVTLAPNLTELVFEIGAGDQLVGVSAWSDFPLPARELPVVGDAFTVDQEQLALLDPDLLLVWESGTPAHAVDELRNAGYTVERIRTRSLGDVGMALRRIGKLTGRSSEAEVVAARFQAELEALRQSQAGRPSISVFYQVSARPLYTVNREHYVSELIEICGGKNIFDDLEDLAPAISVEAVVDRNPEVMLASTDAGDEAFADWQRWPAVSANLYGNLFLIPADEIGRATPRLIIAGGAMCLALQKARFNREALSGR
ncbi:MAG: helical backbone metal receptor [Woeseiaceae bacterium]